MKLPRPFLPFVSFLLFLRGQGELTQCRHFAYKDEGVNFVRRPTSLMDIGVNRTFDGVQTTNHVQ